LQVEYNGLHKQLSLIVIGTQIENVGESEMNGFLQDEFLEK